jgi:hypothetical protein
LQVHHLNYKRLGREKDRDLKVLCRRCHEFDHGIQTVGDDHLRSINNPA